MKSVIVTGGAGYIGSHTSLALAEKGYLPVVYDNLANGHREFVQWGPFEQGDIRDRAHLDDVMSRYDPVAIVHLAGLIEVGASVTDPITFFDNNVAGSIALFGAAEKAGIDKIVFSSSCAIYGIPQQSPISETHPQAPVSPYGTSKWLVERMLSDLDRCKGVRSVVLRYFNAAGADSMGRIGERHDPESHVIPTVIQVAQGHQPSFTINGSNYPTRDGTCVRDFVHVADLADAHCRAVDYLLDEGESVALNIGTGRGTSMQDLVAAVEDVTQAKLALTIGSRRVGDPPELIADNARALAVLGWKPRHDLASILSSAWAWHQEVRPK